MPSDELWSELVSILKDMKGYLEKQDAVQERAKLDRPPKMQETHKPIKGGKAPGFAPAKGVAKEYVPVPTEETSVGEDSLSSETSETMLKQEPEELEEVSEEKVEEEEEEEEREFPSSEDVNELKSLLKSIRSALSGNANVAEVVKSEIRKQMPALVKSEADKMLRKMGFTPTRPDIVRLGIDETIKKSEDAPSKTAELKGQEDIAKVVTDMSKMSWQQLAAIREKTGGFDMFPK